MTHHFNHRNYFIYSSHKTLERADEALDTCFSSGEVCEGERPLIRKINGLYCILFLAD